MHDGSGHQIERVDGERLYSDSGSQMSRIDGETIYDGSGRQIGRADGLRRMLMIVNFYFFLKNDCIGKYSRSKVFVSKRRIFG